MTVGRRHEGRADVRHAAMISEFRIKYFSTTQNKINARPPLTDQWDANLKERTEAFAVPKISSYLWFPGEHNFRMEWDHAEESLFKVHH